MSKERKGLSPQELLVLLMREKAERLASINPSLGNLFFRKEDEEELLALPSETARRILDEFYAYNLEVSGFTTHTCPFCLLQFISNEEASDMRDYCSECSYGARHGICLDDESDLSIIQRALSLEELSSLDVLSRDFYIALRKKIKGLDREGGR